MIEKYLAEVSAVGKIELEENLAPQRNVPPKVVPPGQSSIDRISEFLLVTNGRTRMGQFGIGVIVLPPTKRNGEEGHQNSYLVQCDHRLDFTHGGLVSLLGSGEFSRNLFHRSPLLIFLFLESRFRTFELTVYVC